MSAVTAESRPHMEYWPAVGRLPLAVDLRKEPVERLGLMCLVMTGERGRGG